MGLQPGAGETAKKHKLGKLRAYVLRSEFMWEISTCFVGLIAGRVVIMNDVSPFASAFVAAVSMTSINALYAFLGTAVGLLFLTGTVRYPAFAACTLYYLSHLIWRKIRRNCERFERLLLLLTVNVILLPIFYCDGLQMVLKGSIALCASVLMALLMHNALRALRTLEKRHVLTDGEQLCMSVSFGVLLLGLTDICAFGFSLSVVLLLLFAMIAAYARGNAGVAVAVAISVMLTIGGDFSLSFVGGIAACALSGAALRSLDTLGVLGGFIACCLLVGTYVFTAPHTINLINLAVAGALFLAIPREHTLRLCAFIDAGRERERFAQKSVLRMRSCTADEMRRTAAVVREMAYMYQPIAKSANEPTDAFLQWTAHAAYGVCADCSLKKICWKDWTRASHAIMALLNAKERGDKTRMHLPFDPACKHILQMVMAAEQAKNQYLAQRAMRIQTMGQNAFIHRQFTGVSEILESLSRRVMQDRWLDEDLEKTVLSGLDRRGFRVYGAEATFPQGRLELHVRVPMEQLLEAEPFAEAVSLILRRPIRILHAEPDGKLCTLVMEEGQNLSASMGTAGIAISSGGVSGDSAGERRMESGRVLYALSDGMGAGETAKNESDAALRLLFDLYETGFSRDVALESVNRLLLGRQDDMYATLDAVHIDLRSGEAEFMKYGAPPSYVYRNQRLHAVKAEALPAGILNEAVPAILKAKLRRDDAVVMLSDGALDALGDRAYNAIQAILATEQNSQQAAQKLMEEASQTQYEDDMTVMVIRIA